MNQRLIDQIRWEQHYPFDISDEQISETYDGSYAAASCELRMAMDGLIDSIRQSVIGRMFDRIGSWLWPDD